MTSWPISGTVFEDHPNKLQWFCIASAKGGEQILFYIVEYLLHSGYLIRCLEPYLYPIFGLIQKFHTL